MKEYLIMYSDGKTAIPVTQTGIPTRELANKAMANLQSKPQWHQKTLFLQERTRQGADLPKLRHFRNQPVYTLDWYYGEALSVGDFVDEEVVDCFINALPPACMRSNCTQLGEPYSSRIDTNGKARSTYWTFKRIADSVWEFCGDCFRGENIQSETAPAYIG